jgi:hypothetical protein
VERNEWRRRMRKEENDEERKPTWTLGRTSGGFFVHPADVLVVLCSLDWGSVAVDRKPVQRNLSFSHVCDILQKCPATRG